MAEKFNTVVEKQIRHMKFPSVLEICVVEIWYAQRKCNQKEQG